MSVFCLLGAWLCASGAMLDVTEVFAWMRMFSGYAQSCSVSEALSRTFDPARPCAICLAVQKTKAATHEQAPPGSPPASAKMLLLVWDRAEPAISARPADEWTELAPQPRPAPVLAVPVRPPRAVA